VEVWERGEMGQTYIAALPLLHGSAAVEAARTVVAAGRSGRVGERAGRRSERASSWLASEREVMLAWRLCERMSGRVSRRAVRASGRARG
jgi:hypothetical protein